MIYLDNSATTPTRREVAEFISEYSQRNFFNPSSLYRQAIKVKNDLDNARNKLMDLLGANDGTVVFTGSATEANNTIVYGLARKNKKILISMGEHSSVYEAAKNLDNQGYNIEYIKLLSDGSLDLEDLKSKMSKDVNLVSIFHVSNETGAINNINAISKIVKSTNNACLLHSDGVQAFGKTEINLSNLNVDLYTISAHKIYGPKGVAAMYVRNNVNMKPLILGGGQEMGLRSGTENPAGILGFVMAAEIIVQNLDENKAKWKELKKLLIDELNKRIKNITINSDSNCVDNVVSVSFHGIRGETLLHMLEDHDICVSTGSACSGRKSGNRTLTSMGLSQDKILGNLRFSFGESTKLEDIYTVVNVLEKEYNKLLLKETQ